MTPSKERVKRFCLVFAIIIAMSAVLLALEMVVTLYPWAGTPLLAILVAAAIAWGIVA